MPRNRSEAELRAAGVASVKLRLSSEHKRRLQALATESGFSLSDMVEALIDRECLELEALRATGAARRLPLRRRALRPAPAPEGSAVAEPAQPGQPPRDS